MTAGVGRGGPAVRGAGQGRGACPLRPARLHPVVGGGGRGIRADAGSGQGGEAPGQRGRHLPQRGQHQAAGGGL